MYGPPARQAGAREYAGRMAAAPELWVVHLGRLPYAEGLALQERVRDARERGRVPDTLLLLEHDPVYTRGRRTAPGELPMTVDWYAERGIEIVEVDRGGRATYHGPGQLVGYPIVRTGDVLAHVRGMERALVAALADEGIDAAGRTDDGPDYTGVWVGGSRKIASIGVHVRRSITTHGFAVNVDNDLEPFEWIVAMRYTAGANGTIVSDDRAGGIPRGVDISGAGFHSYLTHSPEWYALSQADRDRIEGSLPVIRVGAPEPGTSGGYWTSDRAYSSNGTGVSRGMFKSL